MKAAFVHIRFLAVKENISPDRHSPKRLKPCHICTPFINPALTHRCRSRGGGVTVVLSILHPLYGRGSFPAHTTILGGENVRRPTHMEPQPNPPSSSPPFLSRAWYIPSCCPCTGLKPRRSQGNRCLGRLGDWRFCGQLPSPTKRDAGHHVMYLWMLVRTAATSYVGLHLFWRMSRQSSPVA